RGRREVLVGQLVDPGGVERPAPEGGGIAAVVVDHRLGDARLRRQGGAAEAAEGTQAMAEQRLDAAEQQRAAGNARRGCRGAAQDRAAATLAEAAGGRLAAPRAGGRLLRLLWRRGRCRSRLRPAEQIAEEAAGAARGRGRLALQLADAGLRLM